MSNARNPDYLAGIAAGLKAALQVAEEKEQECRDIMATATKPRQRRDCDIAASEALIIGQEIRAINPAVVAATEGESDV